MKVKINQLVTGILAAFLMMNVALQPIGALEIKSVTPKSTVNDANIGNTYYVDSNAGNDDNDGMSESNAFATLAKINSMTLQPGDRVYLKNGSEFDEQFKPKGAGTIDNPIIIDSYGDHNNKPIINGGGKIYEGAMNNTSAAVLIENMQYIKVNNLEVTNDDVFNQTDSPNDPNNNRGTNQRRIGIHITINEDAETFVDNQRAWKGIEINNCYIHDVDGDEQRGANKVNGGIGIEVFFRNSNGVYPYFDGVTLDSNTIEKVDRTGIKGIRLTELTLKDTDGGDGIRYNAVRAAEDKNQSGRNFVVKNNDLSNIGGDGILIDSTIGTIVERNVLFDHTKRSSLANAGIWCWNTRDVLFQYNESYGGPTYNQDGCSYDCDYNSAGTIFQYNYSHDTPMGFMLLMGGNQMDIVRYNISQDDGMAWRHFSSGSTTPSYIYNNVFYYDGDKWEWSKSDKLQKNYEFYNNVFYNYNQTVPTKWGEKTDWENAKLENNVVYEASNRKGTNEITNAIYADPLFKNPGSGKTKDWESLKGYELQSNSPLINKGSYVYLDTSGGSLLDKNKNYQATKDFYGNPLYNGTVDIGVHEVAEQTSVRTDLEANGTYKIYAPECSSFLQNNDTNKAILNVKPDSRQEVILVSSKDGYKIKLRDTNKNTYMYLTVQDDEVIFSEDMQSVWQIEDCENGLFRLSLNNKVLAYENKTIVLQNKNDSVSQQWYLQFIDSSKAFNSGGEEVEGYSKDQEFNENNKQAGYYGNVNKVSKSGLTAVEDIYKTALTGDSFGYKIPVSKGSYNIKLHFLELENVAGRTFDILINGDIYAEQYVVDDNAKVEEIGTIYPKDGYIDVQLKATYNKEGIKTNALLNGISLEKSVNTDVNMSLNCGGVSIDGLMNDAPYPTKGSGYYGESQVIDFTRAGRPSPDGGIPSAMETGREGQEFGYKFKVQPGHYRVKLLFNDGADSHIGDRIFDIYINGELVSENFDLVKEAGGNKKGIDFTTITKSAGGLIDIKLVGKDGKKALVNAIIIDNLSKQESRENILTKATVSASSQENDNLSAKGAIDGNQATRWGSGFSDNQWIQAELDHKYMVDTVFVDWTPGAYSTKYHIEVSLDGQEWNRVSSVTDARPGLNVISFAPVEAKYIRIFGEQRNDIWGMSITELEAYGQEIKGESAIIGSSQKNDDQSYRVAVGVEHIYKRYTKMNVTLQYDQSKVEYLGNEVTDLNDQLVFIEKNINDNNGEIQYTYELKSSDAFLNAKEFMKVDFKPLNNVRSAIKVNIEFSDAAAHLTSLPEKSIYIKDEVGKGELEELIQMANGILDKAVIGKKPGNYPQENADLLKTCIQNAQIVFDHAQTENYLSTYTDLEKGIEDFKKSVIISQYAYYYKDYSQEKSVDYGGEKSAASIVNDKLCVNLKQAGAIAYDNQAPLLDEGTFIVKFTIDNIKDQIRFDVKRTATSKIEIGHENGAWFWGGATDGSWGNFPSGTNKPLKVNEENVVKIVFDKLDNGQTSVSLWVNGQSAGTVTQTFSQEKGNYQFWTRTTAKTLSISELTYTNSPLKTITATKGDHGSVNDLGVTSVFEESDKTFVFTPDEGYEVAKVLVDGKEVLIENNQYTFEFITDNHTLDVQFKKIVVGRSELQTLYNEHKNDVQGNYTDESWKVFTDALNHVKTTLNNENSTEEDIKQASDSLKSAIHDRKIRSADYSQVEKIILTIPKDLSVYTDVSVENLNRVLQSIDRSLDITQQEKVNTYVKDIEKMMKQLVLKLADYKEVDKILSDIPKNLDVYTDDSVQELNDAINGVKRDLDITKQNIVDQYVVTIRHAIKNLKLKDIDIENSMIKDKETGVTIIGKLPEGIQLLSKIYTQVEVNNMVETFKKINTEFFKKGTIEKIYDIGLMFKGVKYQPDGTVIVKIELDDSLKSKKLGIIYIDEKGNIKKIDSTTNQEYIQFQTSHFSKYAIVSYSQEDIEISLPDEIESPKTNDNSNIMMYGMIGIVSMAGIYMIIKRRKEEK